MSWRCQAILVFVRVHSFSLQNQPEAQPLLIARVAPHISYCTHHLSHVPLHAPPVTRPAERATCHTSNCTRHLSHIQLNAPPLTHPTARTTCHTSNCMHHLSHVQLHVLPPPPLPTARNAPHPSDCSTAPHIPNCMPPTPTPFQTAKCSPPPPPPFTHC